MSNKKLNNMSEIGNIKSFVFSMNGLSNEQIKIVYDDIQQRVAQYEKTDDDIAEYYRCQSELLMNYMMSIRFDGSLERMIEYLNI